LQINFGINFTESRLEALTQKLNAAEQRLELISNTILIGIWDWDIINNKLVWNDAMFELFGVNNPGVSVYGTGRCYYDIDGKPYRFLGINLEMPKIYTRCDCSFNQE